jgi:transcriptional regulator with XRE-family HTH domain
MAALVDTWPDAPRDETFGALIRRRRLARGWSQETLAAAAGLHHDSVTKLERDLYVPRPETAAALAAALARPAALLPPTVGRRMPGRVASSATAGAFGALLAGYRRRAGLSQHALGQASGRNPSAINRYESGERDRPERETVDALACALGLTERETDLLLVAAGYAPGWARDGTVRQLARLLAGDAVLATALRVQVAALARMTDEGDEG